jgi:hypothetical protein
MTIIGVIGGVLGESDISILLFFMCYTMYIREVRFIFGQWPNRVSCDLDNLEFEKQHFWKFIKKLYQPRELSSSTFSIKEHHL